MGPAAGDQHRQHGIEVDGILPGHPGYLAGQGRAFRVRIATRVGTGSRHGRARLSEAQLRELRRRISRLLGPAARSAGDHERHEPLPGEAATADGELMPRRSCGAPEGPGTARRPLPWP
jgi:hypothetical protein